MTSAMSGEPQLSQLQLKGIAHSFGGSRVLTDVSFDIEPGTLVGLIGPNGSGKTTLFNVISGFLSLQRGSIAFMGRTLVRESVEDRSMLGLVRTFQTPKVFEHMTVLENVVAGLHKKTRSGLVANMFLTSSSQREHAESKETALQTCREFGLGSVASALAGTLAAGQRRNLELARACVGRPNLLMLDEPSSGLSHEEVNDLRAMLRKLQQEGLTIFLVSHDMELMQEASEVHALSAGEIVASGSIAQIQQDPVVKQIYLGL